MRAALLAAALTAGLPATLMISGQAVSATPAHHRHFVHRHAHIAHGYHIPRFNQGEAEAYVHTVYPYRTGLYVPWPDAYANPYPYPYYYPY